MTATATTATATATATATTAVVLAMAMVTAGCGLGLGGGEGGGSDHLPTQSAGPYGKPVVSFDTPADEPYVLSQSRVHLRDPAALPRDDGGIRLWFGREPVDAPGSEIWYAELADITELPDRAPEPAVVADQAWEQGRVGAPAVVAAANGSLVMFYEGGDSARGIGRAVSTDGTTWTKDPGNPVVAGAEPTVGAIPGGGFAMYLTRPDAPDPVDAASIWRADSADGVTWARADAPVIVPRRVDPDAFDRDRVSDPFVIVRETGAGAIHYALFFNGERAAGDDPGVPAEASIGWAGSFDGTAWTRFGGPDAPVVEPGGVSERGPSAIVASDGGVLFFHEIRQGTDRIAVAVHP